MAVTKIWKINGWIGDCLLYIENPNKTQNPLVIGDPKLKEEEYQSLTDVIEYAEDGNKTVRDTERFVSGVNCDAETARQEMILAKNAFDKNDGICAYHAIQSFAPGEVTPETAHEIGIRLAKEMWGERYQVLVATHLDHEHTTWATALSISAIRITAGYGQSSARELIRKKWAAAAPTGTRIISSNFCAAIRSARFRERIREV